MEALGDERTQAHGSHSAEGNHVQSEGRDGGLSWGAAGHETHFSAPCTGAGTSHAEGLTQPQRVVLRPLRLGRGQDVLPGRKGQGKVCQLKFLTK